jgi:cation transport regulator ChaC
LSTSGKVWYFAYGTDLNVDQMRKLVGQWQLSKRALARNYRLSFNAFSKKRGKIYVPNLLETGKFEDTVSGVVYHITQDQLKALENNEGMATTDIHVELEDGNEISHAKTFIYKTEEREHEPPRDYLRVIREGLVQHGYDEARIRSMMSRFGK